MSRSPAVAACLALATVAWAGGCAAERGETASAPAQGLDPGAVSWERESARMVETQLRTRDISDPRVLDAMGTVPRHLFVPEAMRANAYGDHPLPIGYEQTISQPYIVAYMTQLLAVDAEAKVLEIGTGSGYQAAILAEAVREVYTIEIVPELAERARRVLSDLGYANVHVREGDGYQGWPEQAPFDAIIVTAAPDHVPQPLVDQLADGANLVIPIGTVRQEMAVLTRIGDAVSERRTLPVRFVPMTGEAARPPGE